MAMPNRLINETSPYLLQHAHNPVDWYPWGAEAFEKAAAEDKPVLVSIGYAACHWCHVMEHESFEDEQAARLMNELLVAIKVDREERPDIDSIYMNAVQQMHGHGGWPLNVFLMPDGRPFYGGTYFPPTDRSGMPSWSKVVTAVAEAYTQRRSDVLENARVLTEALRASSERDIPDEDVSPPVLDQAYAGLSALFDAEHGGFGDAPKFPQSMPQEFLLRYYQRTGEEQAREMVEISLRQMANGGIYDHLGGGFARYSTDAFWRVPHFEKMLYDNALLASLYLQAFQVTGDAHFRTVAEETLDYLLRDLRHADGGFFSSQDADSEGVEGKYYVWSPSEIEDVLGPGARMFNRYYGVERVGGFEAGSILHVSDSAAATAREFGVTVAEFFDRLRPMRRDLFAERSKRVPPATDDKVLTAWNALAMRSLAEAAFVLDRQDYRDAAERNADFLLRELQAEGRLLRTWKDGKAHIRGYLEDYAYLINGLLSLHTATFSHRWLREARRLTDEMIDLFWDDAAESFYDVGVDHEELIVRPRDMVDNAISSGNSAAAEALLRIAALTGDTAYADKGERLLTGVVLLAVRYPLGFGNWLRIMELHLAPPLEVVVVGDLSAEATRELLRPLRERFLPLRCFVGVAPMDDERFETPVTEGRTSADRPTAYVCRGYVCNLPVVDPIALEGQLASWVDGEP